MIEYTEYYHTKRQDDRNKYQLNFIDMREGKDESSYGYRN